MKIKERAVKILWLAVGWTICHVMATCSGVASTTPTVTATRLSAIGATHPPTVEFSPTPAFTPTPYEVPTTPVATSSGAQAIDRSTPLTSPVPLETRTLLHPCGKSIVFEQSHSLALIDPCNGEMSSLANDAWHEEWPQWSPDGQHVAFLSDRFRGGDDYRDLWVADIVTGELLQLTVAARISSDKGAFLWSPDGSEILYQVSEDEIRSSAWILNLNSGTTHSLPNCLRGPFSWSANENKIALQKCVDAPRDETGEYEDETWFPGNLVVVSRDGSLLAGRTDLDGYRVGNSNGWLWSPDGQNLAVAFFASLLGDGGDLELVMVENQVLVTVAKAQDLLPSLQRRDVQSLAWSPDNEQLAFVVVEPFMHDRPYWGQVYVVDRHFTHFRTLTQEGMRCDDVQWSPSGAQLAFVCDDGEPNASIWLVNADGSNLRAITKPAPDVRSPQWRPSPQP